MQTPQNSLKKYLQRRRKRRIIIIIAGLCFLVALVALIFYALQDKASFFRTPSEITVQDRSSHHMLRLGGYVEEGSVVHKTGTDTYFFVTDFHDRQKVYFNGVLPDLFREGQGVIAEGYFKADGLFVADRVLAKHDEKYVPKEVADKIKVAEGREVDSSAKKQNSK